MANPSNYRYDAYSDIPSNITLTERHLVPSVSPYIVALTEVPVKSAPSTTSAKYINDISGGSVAYGASLTEVSTTPIAGQYYPDYHTNADNNENWNTGQILFAAADAGKIVEITYLAKGTLTGVTSAAYPSWWRDRGDGSDGDFYPTGNVTINGRKNYRSVYIPTGVTVIVDGFVDIRCQGMFINAGIINGDGCGGNGGRAGGGRIMSTETGYDWNYYYPWEYGEKCSGGYGGAGANGSTPTWSVVNGSSSSVTEDVIKHLMRTDTPCMGCGGSGGNGRTSSTSANAYGGPGGRGGGSVQVVTTTYKNIGTITVRGANGTGNNINGNNSGGGGGGGTIKIICERNLATGTGIATPGSGGGSGWYRIVELGAS